MKHKEERFRNGDEHDITSNEAFLLTDLAVRKGYEQEYQKLSALCYGDLPKFEDVLKVISEWSAKL